MAEEEKEEAKEEEEKPEGEEGEGGEGEGEEGEEGGSKKKVLFIIIFLLLLLGGGGAGLFMAGMIPGFKQGPTEEELAAESAPQILYFDLEEFLVNLNNPGKQVSFLKAVITLELPNLKAKTMVEAKMPRIRDSFQVYLRELRSSDLQGSAGIQRLREELLLRINKIMEPEKVNDILFKEIIVQ